MWMPAVWRLLLEDGVEGLFLPGEELGRGTAPSPSQGHPEHPPYLRSILGGLWGLGAQTLGMSGFSDHLPPNSVLSYFYL